MGMYYGLINSTQCVYVSSYWKGAPPSVEEMEYIIVFFGWNYRDEISSSSYCTYYVWDWDEKNWVDKDFEYDENVVDKMGMSKYGVPQFDYTKVRKRELEKNWNY